VPSASQVTLTVVGYTTAMDKYMAAADLLVGKPGGLTTSEAVARGLPMVIVNPIPGQEERNADHLLEEGAAIRCNNLRVLAWKVDRLLDDRDRLTAMWADVGRLARPDAARAVVTVLVESEAPECAATAALGRAGYSAGAKWCVSRNTEPSRRLLARTRPPKTSHARSYRPLRSTRLPKRGGPIIPPMGMNNML